MKSALIATAVAAMAVALTSQAFADDHDHDHDHYGYHEGHHYVHHKEWRRGSHMRDEDWRRGEHIDYREHHLRSPPRGYEWREVDGNYVLAAVATGVIASVIVAAATGH